MKSISVRISDEEKLILTKRAETVGLNVSSYIRKVLFDNQPVSGVSHQALNILSGLSTLINKANLYGYGENNYMSEIEREVYKLWQILS